MIKLLLIAAPILIITVIFFLFKSVSESFEPTMENTFRATRSTTLISVIGLVVSGGAMLAVFVIPKDGVSDPALYTVIVGGGFAVFLFLSLYSLLCDINYRLILGEDELTYINLLRIRKNYRYEDITRVIGQNKGGMYEKYIIFIGEKKITIGYGYGNLSDFRILLKRRLKRHKNKTNIEYKNEKISDNAN